MHGLAPLDLGDGQRSRVDLCLIGAEERRPRQGWKKCAKPIHSSIIRAVVAHALVSSALEPVSLNPGLASLKQWANRTKDRTGDDLSSLRSRMDAVRLEISHVFRDDVGKKK